MILKAYRERASGRALRRWFGISIPTVWRWIQKSKSFAFYCCDTAIF
ncbi:MAG: helix-turn-helix domain-containing protein [Thermoflexus sp.]|nr:helix-turn-helix domain-containing protein [Thermoflexus sp.]